MSEIKEEEEQFTTEILPEEYPNFDLSFKLIIIGDSGVGKSSLTQKATKNIFESHYNFTIGFEFLSMNIKVNEKIIKLQIWDTCGQEIYRSLITNFFRSSSIAIVMYAINDKKSFKDIDFWINEVKQNSNPDIKIFLIGNKKDLEEQREVSEEDIKEKKEKYNFNLILESSAKTGLNVKEIFLKAACLLYKEIKKNSSICSSGLTENDYNSEPMIKSKKSTSSKSGGCRC